MWVEATAPDAAEEASSAGLAGGFAPACSSVRVNAAPQTPQLHRTCDMACPFALDGDCHFLDSSLAHIGQIFFTLFLSPWAARLVSRFYSQQRWLPLTGGRFHQADQELVLHVSLHFLLSETFWRAQ
jgi:hypothetical protein